MKYQVAERGYEPSDIFPDGMKEVLDPFDTQEDAMTGSAFKTAGNKSIKVRLTTYKFDKDL